MSKSGTPAKLILNFTNAYLATNGTYQAGLNIRAWKSTSAPPIDGSMFDLANPSPAPNDSSPYDVWYFPTGQGTIGYATQDINRAQGETEHFQPDNGCGVPSPGPYPTGYIDNSAVEYRGQIYITNAGNYNFGTYTDDSSGVWIDPSTSNPAHTDTSCIVYQSGCCSSVNSPPQALAAGYHDIIVRLNQGGGPSALQLYWDPTGSSNTNNLVPIPGSVFYHQKATPYMTGP